MENKNIITTDHVLRDNLGKDPFDNLVQGIGEYWGAFYRENPHRFVLDYFQINIYPFQQFLMYELNKSEQSCILATRGLGKSWILGLYACVRAVLYPGSNILVAAKVKKQAKLLITSKIMNDLYNKSEALRREIKTLRQSNNECIVEFWNGSIIEAVVSNDNARGYRANCLIIDEYRMLDVNTVDSILIPFLNTSRQPGYLKNPKYSHLVEENIEVYLSSGWYSADWSYQRYKETVDGMIHGENMFACSIPFTTAIEHGLTTKKRIRKEMKKESMTIATFMMEYCGLFYKETDGAFFNSAMINPCRVVTRAFYPPSNLEYLKYKNSDEKPYKLPKLKDEIRVIACDIAVSSGESNDNSVYICMRMYPNEDGDYEREVNCIESYNGKEAESQAIRIKELFEDYDADYIILDTASAGVSVWSYIQKRNCDVNRGIEYDAYTCFNEDKTVNKDLAKIGIPIVYSMKANQDINHRIALSLRDNFVTQNLRLPLPTIEARNNIYDDNKISKEELQRRVKVEGELLLPFEQTDSLVYELINLEHEIREGKVKLIEKSGNRKDRCSALMYGNFLCDYFEQQAYNKRNKKKKGGHIFLY